MNKNTKIVLFVAVISVLCILIYYNMYNISKSDLESYIIDQSKMPKEGIEFVASDYKNGLKAYMYINRANPQSQGIAVFKKGINNRYMLSSISYIGEYYMGDKFVTCENYMFKTNIITAGDNREGEVSFIEKENSNCKIVIDKDYFVKIFSLKKKEGYNFFDRSGDVILWY